MLKKPSGLRARLIISFLLLTTLSLSLLGAYTLWYFYQHNLSSLHNNLLSQSKIIEQLLREKMSGPLKKAEIDEKIKELGLLLELRITIVDVNGVVLADSETNPALMDNHLSRPEIKTALAGDNGFSLRPSSTQGESLLYVSTPMWNGNEITGVVRIATSLAHIDKGFSTIASALLLAVLITALLSIVVGIILARKYTAPLEHIISVSRQIADGQLDKRVFIHTDDELELLAHAVNNLTSSLEDKINDAAAKTRKLELILEHMDNAVLLFDRYGRVTTFNKKAAEIFVLSPAMLGDHNIQVIGNSLLDQAIQKTISTSINHSIDLKTNIHNSKRVFQVSVAPISVNEIEPAGALCVFHDITTLQEMQERQADFVANASHELSTPLTTIKGFAETLLDGALAEPELSRKFTGIILTQAEKMHRLIKDLLQLAKLNSCECSQQLQTEEIDACNLLTLVSNELSSRAAAKNLTVTLNCPAEPLLFCSNANWLKQVLTNLLENSIKYTPDNGKIHFTATACPATTDREAMVSFSVKDSGIGIPANELPLIFDRFYRVDKARARSAGGVGLGLAIVKFIVAMLGGHIAVSSQVDAGSVFTVTLPVRPSKCN